MLFCSLHVLRSSSQRLKLSNLKLESALRDSSRHRKLKVWCLSSYTPKRYQIIVQKHCPHEDQDKDFEIFNFPIFSLLYLAACCLPFSVLTGQVEDWHTNAQHLPLDSWNLRNYIICCCLLCGFYAGFTVNGTIRRRSCNLFSSHYRQCVRINPT